MVLGKHLGYNCTSIPFAPYGNHWKNLRRIWSLEMLSISRLQALSFIRTEEVRSMILKLLRSKNQTVDMRSIFFNLIVNVITRMIAGKRYFGDNVAVLAEEEAKKICEIMRETVSVGSGPNAIDFLPVFKWLGFGGVEKKFSVLQKKRDGFMHDLLEERRRRMASDDDKIKDYSDGGREMLMIDVLLSLQESDPEFLKDETIRSLIKIFSILYYVFTQFIKRDFLTSCNLQALLTAGADTSTCTMEWSLSLLLNNPDILKKAQNEIDNQIGFDRFLNESDLPNLHYLQCLICETLRLFPPGPFLIPHESSDECMVGGFRIPQGTMLLVNMWAVQNDPKIWKDPTKFKPERFEGIEGTRDGLKFMPFGIGRRSCPSEGLAMLVIGLTLGLLIELFEW